jgi:hypothetical protein
MLAPSWILHDAGLYEKAQSPTSAKASVTCVKIEILAKIDEATFAATCGGAI